jgi:ABC-type uncharacterized transport system ATPase subunit
MIMGVVLAVENVSKTYGGVEAVRNISLKRIVAHMKGITGMVDENRYRLT